MPISYGVSGGSSRTVNANNELLFVQGASGDVKAAIKKYKRTETTTENFPETIALPALSSTTWTRYELRLSNTDWARESTTFVSYGVI